MSDSYSRPIHKLGTAALGLALALAAGSPLLAESQAGSEGTANATAAVAASESSPNLIRREGMVIEFGLNSLLAGGKTADNELMEGDNAEVVFRITDAENGEPVQGLYPVAWMDIGEAWDTLHSRTTKTSCKDRVGVYLQGLVGMRPMIDLNSYFVLVMNQDPTISVIDPIIGVAGRTKLYAQVILKRAGADWAKSGDEKRLFVSMPVADMVALVDTEKFNVTHNLPAGDEPTRVVIQQDEKYLWVANDSRNVDKSGVTAIDLETLRTAGFIKTGKGHHELVLSSDDRFLFVSNRDDGTVSVIDTAKLEKVKDIAAARLPIAMDYSALADVLYIADGSGGRVLALDTRTLEIAAEIKLTSGLGPLRFSDDGRWAVVINPLADEVYVLDASNNTLAHTVAVEGRPFQLTFSRAFAYIRSLDNERLSMINLSELGTGTDALVTKVPVGKLSPGQSRDLVLADTMVPAPGEASVLVVSPADTTVYYYMEGMNAPMGNFRNYGHRPMAVNVVDRTLKEKQPGTYTATVKIPAAGEYDVAFLLDAPSILNCFKFTARPNPMLQEKYAALAVDYLLENRRVAVGETVQLDLRLTDPKTKQPLLGLADVQVLFYHASGQGRTVLAPAEIGEGIYRVALPIPRVGGYYVWISAPSLKIGFQDAPNFSLLGMKKAVPVVSDPG